MAEIDFKIKDVHSRIQKERKILDGFQQVRAASKNPIVIASAESKIRESQRSISYFEESLHELQLQKANSQSGGHAGKGLAAVDASSTGRTSSSGEIPDLSPMRVKESRNFQSGGPMRDRGGRTNDQLGHAGAAQMSSAYGGSSQYATPRPKKTHYTNLDLIKQDTPYTTAKISRMLHQLEFKLQVENQYKEGIDKMIKLYSADGDRKSRSDAEAKRLESSQKISLLKAALQRYKTLHIHDDVNEEEDAGGAGDAATDRRGNLRRPLTGKLDIVIKSVRDIDHAPLTASRSRYPIETSVVVKVEDTPRAKTHPSRSDRWNEEFSMDVDKANEIEVLLYDKAGPEPFIPVGMVWIRISDVVEELRRKKVGMDSGPGWVTAANVNVYESSNSGATNPDLSGLGGQDAASKPSRIPDGMPTGHLPDGIETWFAVEPAGAILLKINFVKENSRKRPLEAGLGRQGAVRKKKEEVHEMNGHQFVQRQFYQIMRCALCSEFLLNAAGYQCEDCQYTCHKKCYPKVVTKCISKSSSETDQDEEQLRHKIPHRFEPLTNIGANWCCHCGYILPLGRKNARKCSECNITCHTDCTHLVPDYCGMSMETANQLLRDMKLIKSKQQTQRGSTISSGASTSSSSTLTPNSASNTSASLEQELAHRNMLREVQMSPNNTMPLPRPAVQQQKSYAESPPVDRRPLPQPRRSSGQSESLPRPLPSLSALQGTTSPSGQRAGRERTTGKYTLDGIELDPGRAPSSIAAANASNSPRTGTSRPLPSTQAAQAHHAGRTVSAQEYSNYAPGSRFEGDSHSSSSGIPGQPASGQPRQHNPIAFVGQPGYPPVLGPPKGPSNALQPASVVPSNITMEQRSVSQGYTPSQQPRPAQSTVARQDGFPPSKPPKDFNIPPALRTKIGLDDFNFLAVLGKGNFGKVMLAEEKHSKALYAIKVLKKEFIIENDEIESTRSEKRVFLAANRQRHPFLIGLHSCFQTETRVYFVMEYVAGGDLMLHIQREQFTPQRAQYYAAEVLLALEYFHRNGIIYRDLKLDNILLTMEGHIKVADYGLCKEDMWHGNTTGTFCGTPEFMAPEILLEQRYGRAVDWWAFGVLIYELLLGQSPFKGDDEDEIFDAILEDEPLYPIQMPRDSVSILQSLLTRNPAQRLGSGTGDAEEIKRHPFFRNIDWNRMLNKMIPPPFLPSIGSPTDVSNFDSEFTSEQPRLTPIHSRLTGADQAEFNGFSYISSWAARGQA